MNDRSIVAPTVEPVTIDELKAHLRVTSDVEDADLARLITAAREHAEGQMGRALAEQTRETSADAFPKSGVLRLGFAPVVSISSVKYLDEAGVEQTLDPTSYIVDTRSEPGAVMPTLGKSWPATAALPSSVRVQYVCGTTAPQILKQAILFIAAHWYEQGLPVNVGNIVTSVPHTLDAILWANRVI